MNYQLKYSKRRKYIGLSVEAAQVTLHLPYGASKEAGLAFLQRKRSWVDKQLHKQQQRLRDLPTRQYQTGESWSLLGELLTLHLKASNTKSHVRREGDHLVLYRHRGLKHLKPLLERFYQDQAQVFFECRAKHYAAKLGLCVTALYIRATRSRWGSCSSRGVLQFHPLLMQAPEAVADYVAVHEVCHLAHMNHSPAFWALVERFCPDYRQHRQWLKENGYRLVL